MAIRNFRPVTPSMRHTVLTDKRFLHRGRPCKRLTCGISSTGGRNNRGVITVRSRGGGVKRLYRMVNFSIWKKFGDAVVKRLEYDPNRTAFLALLEFEDGSNDYVIASNKMSVGSVVSVGPGAELRDGSVMPLSEIPIGFSVYNVSTKSGTGAKLARSAGSYATIVSKHSGKVMLRMRSGTVCAVDNDCYACIGSASNADHKNISLGKAGRSRLMGRRPSVRGVAMNPVDHPHGGGEGKTGTGGPPVTPWGKLTKGAKTVKNKKKIRG